jgi:hypothetical protein
LAIHITKIVFPRYWHRYAFNDVGLSIISVFKYFYLIQELGNPRVRRNLHFYPEDAGPVLREARQGHRWLHDMPSDQTTPMIRRLKCDYYIYEPALLTNGKCCIPFRWFIRKDKAQDLFYAKAWPLDLIRGDESSDSEEGWLVSGYLEIEICERDLVHNFPTLSQHHSRYNVPHPSRLLGGFDFLNRKYGTLILLFRGSYKGEPNRRDTVETHRSSNRQSVEAAGKGKSGFESPSVALL